ncbi:hypothetical protein BRM1_08255 [Brevibacterium sp. BRM-1]|uniref:hypothetical protein n=1 Tax=Brevibacterium sp. BRM-1 TaxID=2999062 RepID=UPI0022807E91|nr:hypothetical protein [Brevibacterium sp. BRM-1]WAL39277.1 hypothetical protein BRM1_08255 [Brevibacterium sp. BRM-1]
MQKKLLAPAVAIAALGALTAVPMSTFIVDAAPAARAADSHVTVSPAAEKITAKQIKANAITVTADNVKAGQPFSAFAKIGENRIGSGEGTATDGSTATATINYLAGQDKYLVPGATVTIAVTYAPTEGAAVTNEVVKTYTIAEDEPATIPSTKTATPSKTPTKTATAAPTKTATPTQTSAPTKDAEPVLSVKPHTVTAKDFVNEKKGVTLTVSHLQPGEKAVYSVAAKRKGVRDLAKQEATADKNGVATWSVYGTNSANPSAYIGSYVVTAKAEGKTLTEGFKVVAKKSSGNDSDNGDNGDNGNSGSNNDNGNSGSNDNGSGDNGGSLPRTGAELGALGVGAALLLVGGATVLVTRRRTSK